MPPSLARSMRRSIIRLLLFCFASCRRSVGVLDVFVEVRDLGGHTIQAQFVEQPRQVLGNLLTLSEDRQERFCATIDEGSLPEQPGINVIEQERSPRRHVDQAALLGAESGFATEGGSEFRSEGQRRASRRGSTVYRMETPQR